MSTEPWLDDDEARAWRAYNRMRGLLEQRIERDLADDGLSGADYTVLVVLSETAEHRIRLHELAELTLWSRSRLSHHLARMERRGLVRREAHPTNQRALDAVLTHQGLAAIEAAAPHHVRSVRRNLIDLLSADEIELLADLSERVVDHLAGVGTTESVSGPS